MVRIIPISFDDIYTLDIRLLNNSEILRVMHFQSFHVKNILKSTFLIFLVICYLILPTRIYNTNYKDI